jgi:hypothetical protein
MLVLLTHPPLTAPSHPSRNSQTSHAQPPTKATTSCNILNILSYICTTTPLYNRSTRASQNHLIPCKYQINALKTPCPVQSLLKLRSKHSMRRNRAAVVLGSEVAALGRYERVPLGEEGDSWSTGWVSKVVRGRALFVRWEMIVVVGALIWVRIEAVRTPHEPAAPGGEDEG